MANYAQQAAGALKTKLSKSSKQKTKTHKSLKLSSKRTRPDSARISSSWILLFSSLKQIWLHKWTFLKFSFLHLALLLLLAPNVEQLRDHQIIATMLFFVFALGELAVIRAFYGVTKLKSKKLKIKPVIYRAQVQLIPMLLVTSIITIQLIPLAFALVLYQTAALSQIPVADTLLLKYLFAAVSILISLPTFYWLSMSFMAFFAVSLEGVAPMNAWRGAAKMCENSRAKLLLKLLFMGAIFTTMFIIILFSIVQLGIDSLQTSAANIALALILPLLLQFGFSIYRELIDARS